MKRVKIIDALIPRTRARLLGALYSHPHEWRYLREIAAELELSPSTIQNDIHRFIASGILERNVRGNRSYFRPNSDCIIFQELLGIVRKTVGIADVVLAAMLPFQKQIDAAFIFGSFARNEETVDSDVDLMLIGTITLGDLALAIRDLERTLRRPVNPLVLSREEALKSLKIPNHFLQTVFSGEKLWLMENNHDLARLIERRPDQSAHNKRA